MVTHGCAIIAHAPRWIPVTRSRGMWLLILSIITGTSIMVRQNQVCGPSLPGLVLPLLALLRVRHPPLLVSILFGADLVVFVRCVVGILPPECMAGGFWVRSASTTLTHSTPGASSWRRAVPTKVPYTTTPKAARTQGAVARRVLVDCATGQTLLVRALFFIVTRLATHGTDSLALTLVIRLRIIVPRGIRVQLLVFAVLCRHRLDGWGIACDNFHVVRKI